MFFQGWFGRMQLSFVIVADEVHSSGGKVRQRRLDLVGTLLQPLFSSFYCLWISRRHRRPRQRKWCRCDIFLSMSFCRFAAIFLSIVFIIVKTTQRRPNYFSSCASYNLYVMNSPKMWRLFAASSLRFMSDRLCWNKAEWCCKKPRGLHFSGFQILFRRTDTGWPAVARLSSHEALISCSFCRKSCPNIRTARRSKQTPTEQSI